MLVERRWVEREVQDADQGKAVVMNREAGGLPAATGSLWISERGTVGGTALVLYGCHPRAHVHQGAKTVFSPTLCFPAECVLNVWGFWPLVLCEAKHI